MVRALRVGGYAAQNVVPFIRCSGGTTLARGGYGGLIWGLFIYIITQAKKLENAEIGGKSMGYEDRFLKYYRISGIPRGVLVG